MKAGFVIPACLESVYVFIKDSGQAGATDSGSNSKAAESPPLLTFLGFTRILVGNESGVDSQSG